MTPKIGNSPTHINIAMVSERNVMKSGKDKFV